MEQAQQRIEVRARGAHGLGVDRAAVGGLDHLEVPRREVVPEESVHCHQGLVDAEFLHQVGDLGHGGVEARAEPAHGQRRHLVGTRRGVFLPAAHQAEGIPYLIAEVAALLAEALVKHDIVAGRGGEHHAHAHTVGAVAVDEVERVGGVAQRLRHLAAEIVAHDAGEIHVAEWLLAHILVSGHDHARHPEEDDVGAGDQRGRGIVIVDLGVAGIVDAVEEGDGPQPR